MFVQDVIEAGAKYVNMKADEKMRIYCDDAAEFVKRSVSPYFLLHLSAI